MNKFNIEKYYVIDEDEINVSSVPMLVRRKLSKPDRIAFTILEKIYDDNVDSIIFASENGEIDRLREIIYQYQTENMVSPIKFSSSVHNFAPSAFSRLHNITKPYTAISAGKETLAAAIWTAVISEGERTCVCYADNIGIGMIITKEGRYTLSDEMMGTDDLNNFIEFLEGRRKFWAVETGVMKKL